jgi:catechol 2,3-dioxygenase-like lactoylglutathione lyase family enzyme
MAKQALVALRIPDLAAGIAFYMEQLDFTLVEQDPSADVAWIMESDGGGPLLLAGPKARDVTPYLVEHPLAVKPGEGQGLHFLHADVDALRATLGRGRHTPPQFTETRCGDRILTVRDPGNNLLRFRTLARHSEHEWLELYLSGGDELEAVVAGLAEPDLDLSLRPDSWTIRHTVHHLADAETRFVWWMKLALAQPGRLHTPDWRLASSGAGNDTLAAAFQSAKRPVAPSVAVVRATRAHVAQIVPCVPDAWACYTLDEQGNKVTFGELVALLTRHLFEHVDEIVETRRFHGC